MSQQPPQAENIDYVCSSCGKVTAGPHKDETVPDPTNKGSYKGSPISHGTCDECSEKFRREAREKHTGHPWWRKL